MGERLLCKQEVIGSIPFTSTTGETNGFAATLTNLACRQAKAGAFAERRRHQRKDAAARRRIDPDVPHGGCRGGLLICHCKEASCVTEAVSAPAKPLWFCRADAVSVFSREEFAPAKRCFAAPKGGLWR